MSLKICVDSGHGGDESGAVFNGIVEKDLNLKTSFLLKAELERCGVSVIMTRTTDVFMSLSDRAKVAKDNACTALISVHFNAFDTKARGTEMIYSFYKQCLESSKWIADCMLNESVKLGTVRRGFWTKESGTYPGHNYYGVLRNLEPIPGVIAEGLFLDNLEDIKFLKDPNFLKNLAAAYAKGICIAYGVGFVPDPALVAPTPVKAPEPVKAAPMPFADWNSVADYAKEGVLLMKELGLMSGDATGKFNPQGTLTRQDFATVMSKVIKKYNLGG